MTNKKKSNCGRPAGRIKTASHYNSAMQSGCRKTMLQKKDNRAAGELEGA